MLCTCMQQCSAHNKIEHGGHLQTAKPLCWLELTAKVGGIEHFQALAAGALFPVIV